MGGESRISGRLSRHVVKLSIESYIAIIDIADAHKKIPRQCSRTLNDIVENTMRRKRLILLHSDKSDAMACRGASDFIGFISRAVESLVSSRVESNRVGLDLILTGVTLDFALRRNFY